MRLFILKWKNISKKLDSALKQKSAKKSILIIGGIIKNFIIRDANCTVFLLRQKMLNNSLNQKFIEDDDLVG